MDVEDVQRAGEAEDAQRDGDDVVGQARDVPADERLAPARPGPPDLGVTEPERPHRDRGRHADGDVAPRRRIGEEAGQLPARVKNQEDEPDVARELDRGQPPQRRARAERGAQARRAAQGSDGEEDGERVGERQQDRREPVRRAPADLERRERHAEPAPGEQSGGHVAGEPRPAGKPGGAGAEGDRQEAGQRDQRGHGDDRDRDSRWNGRNHLAKDCTTKS